MDFYWKEKIEGFTMIQIRNGLRKSMSGHTLFNNQAFAENMKVAVDKADEILEGLEDDGFITHMSEYQEDNKIHQIYELTNIGQEFIRSSAKK